MQVNVTEEEARRHERYKRNLLALQDVKPGSDLYGVLEKTAFHVSLLTGCRDDFKNWISAHISLGIIPLLYLIILDVLL